MKKTITAIAIVLSIACNKQKHESIDSTIPKSVKAFKKVEVNLFREGSSLFEIVQEKLFLYDESDDLISIDSVSNYGSGNIEYSLVYYTSKKGSSNILLKETYANGISQQVESKKCEGACGCYITVFIDANSNMTYSCTCSGCVIVTH